MPNRSAAPLGRHIRWGEATDEPAREDTRPTKLEEDAAPDGAWKSFVRDFYKDVAPTALKIILHLSDQSGRRGVPPSELFMPLAGLQIRFEHLATNGSDGCKAADRGYIEA